MFIIRHKHVRTAVPMYNYRLYGLNLCSDFPLTGLWAGTGHHDITIRQTTFPQPEWQQGKYGLWYAIAEDTVYYRWDTIGRFRITGGREILVDPDPGVEPGQLQVFLLGGVLGMALHQRQLFVLHASAVATPAGVAVFMGDSGWGKSTLAAGLHTRGFTLLSDDIVAVRLDTGNFDVYPGIPECKLCEDALSLLGQTFSSEQYRIPMEEKVLHRMPCDREHDPLPLARIYVLSGALETRIVPIPPAAAAMELVRHTYGVTILHRFDKAGHFQRAVTVAARVPAFRFERAFGQDEFPTLLQLIEDDLTHEYCVPA